MLSDTWVENVDWYELIFSQTLDMMGDALLIFPCIAHIKSVEDVFQTCQQTDPLICINYLWATLVLLNCNYGIPEVEHQREQNSKRS